MSHDLPSLHASHEHLSFFQLYQVPPALSSPQIAPRNSTSAPPQSGFEQHLHIQPLLSLRLSSALYILSPAPNGGLPRSSHLKNRPGFPREPSTQSYMLSSFIRGLWSALLESLYVVARSPNSINRLASPLCHRCLVYHLDIKRRT